MKKITDFENYIFDLDGTRTDPMEVICKSAAR